MHEPRWWPVRCLCGKLVDLVTISQAGTQSRVCPRCGRTCEVVAERTWLGALRITQRCRRIHVSPGRDAPAPDQRPGAR